MGISLDNFINALNQQQVQQPNKAFSNPKVQEHDRSLPRRSSPERVCYDHSIPRGRRQRKATAFSNDNFYLDDCNLRIGCNWSWVQDQTVQQEHLRDKG